MKYMLLIYNSEDGWGDMPQEEIDANMKEWWSYTDALEKAGKLISGDALQPSATATTIRGANRATTVVDGPFAETKEQSRARGNLYWSRRISRVARRSRRLRCPRARRGSR